MTRKKTNEALTEYAHNILAGTSEANRPLFQQLLAQRMNKGRQGTTLKGWAEMCQAIDWCVGRQPIAALTALAWTAALAKLRSRYSVGSCIRTVNAIRGCVRAALNSSVLPYDLDMALSIERGDDEDERPARVITADEFRGLLEQAPRVHSGLRSPTTALMKQAVLWVLWDSGFRNSELRSLNIGDVSFRPDGGATLQLRSKKACLRDGCRLKTGPRGIYVVECVPALKAWLAIHPQGANPAAPVFLAHRRNDGTRRLPEGTLNNFLESCALAARLPPVPERPDQVLLPHDFRHTRCTRMAREPSLNTAQFSMYFWGIPNSKMIGRYVHLAAEDLAAMVRQNVGVDDLGYLQHVEAGDDAAALAALLARIQNRGRTAPTVRVSPSR